MSKIQMIRTGKGLSCLPTNARDTGLISGPGRFHMLWSSQAHVPQVLSLCSRAHELQLLGPYAATGEPVCLKPMLHSKKMDSNKKPVHCSEEQPQLTTTRESLGSNKDPMQPKIKVQKKDWKGWRKLLGAEQRQHEQSPMDRNLEVIMENSE